MLFLWKKQTCWQEWHNLKGPALVWTDVLPPYFMFNKLPRCETNHSHQGCKNSQGTQIGMLQEPVTPFDFPHWMPALEIKWNQRSKLGHGPADFELTWGSKWPCFIFLFWQHFPNWNGVRKIQPSHKEHLQSVFMEKSDKSDKRCPSRSFPTWACTIFVCVRKVFCSP
jgi:hypothetical protein